MPHNVREWMCAGRAPAVTSPLVGEVGAAKLRREGGEFHGMPQTLPPSLPLPHKGGGNEFAALET